MKGITKTYCFNPVSYTHLDVYKRQDLNSVCENNRSGRNIISIKSRACAKWSRYTNMDIMDEVNEFFESYE